MKKLNDEAINEIVKLLNEVNEVVDLLEEFRINITSDPWTATSFNDSENILTWKKKDFENIKEDISEGDKFYIGGNIITGAEHQYKDKWIIAPKELAEVQGKIFKKYLQSIINSISLKHFDLKLKNPYGLTDNCGWENWFVIETTVRESALYNIDEYNRKNQLQRIKENIEWRNKNIKEETYATHMAFDSIEDIINSKETELNSLILDNINPEEKFKIICRAKNINIDEIALDCKIHNIKFNIE